LPIILIFDLLRMLIDPRLREDGLDI
jgi:hypothetical protein